MEKIDGKRIAEGLNCKVVFYEETSSTNEIGKTMTEDCVVLAVRQTQGRGRQGKFFVSQEGGIYFSNVIRTPKLLPAATYTLAAASAVTQCLLDYGFEPKIKWVNDVFCRGKKVCGILVESTFKDGAYTVVTGVGVNYLDENFGEYSFVAGGLYNSTCGINDFAIKLISEVKKQRTDFIETYNRYCTLIGKRIKISNIEGDVKRINADGSVVLATADGEIYIDSNRIVQF